MPLHFSLLWDGKTPVEPCAMIQEAQASLMTISLSYKAPNHVEKWILCVYLLDRRSHRLSLLLTPRVVARMKRIQSEMHR